MDTRYLRTLVDLSQTLNMTHTATRLDYAPSSIAGHVHALELEVGVPLVERHGRAITLTEAGRVLAQQSRRVLDAERDVFTSARNAGGERSLTIGSAASVLGVLLPDIIAEVRARAPGMAISLQQLECAPILSAIAAGDLDAGFTIEQFPALDHLRTTTMSTEILSGIPMVAVTSRAHPLASVTAPSAADVAGVTLISTEVGCRYREAFTSYLDEHGITTGVPIVLDNFEAIRRCIGAGLGIAYLPHFVVERELANGEFVELPIGPQARFALALTWRKGLDAAGLRALRDAAMHRMAQTTVAGFSARTSVFEEDVERCTELRMS